MKICIPTVGAKGMEEKISEHFGGAPYFTIVDLDSNQVEVINNQNQHHTHGQCQPLASLAGKKIDVVICGGISRGAVANLNANGIKVYIAAGDTITQEIDSFKAGKLSEVGAAGACEGHGCH